MIDWSVELDADPNTAGQFVLDTSSLDGSDILGPDTRWVDVGQVVRKISIRRGRTDDSRPYDAGESVCEFENFSGDFDPDNPYGKYVMLGLVKLLGVGTGLRIKANSGGGYDAAVLADGAVRYWKFNETSGNIADYGGSSNTLTNSAGTPSYATTAIAPGLGLSMTFDGTQGFDGVNTGSLSAPYTVEGWYAPTAPTIDGQSLFSTRAPGDTSFDMQLKSNGTSLTGLHGDIGLGNGTWLTTSADATTAIGSVAHVVYVVTTTGYTIYLNGVSVGSGSFSGTSVLFDSTHQPRISPSVRYTGRLSNIAVYGSALTGTQIANHYSLGTSGSVVTMFTGRVEEPKTVDSQFMPTATYTSVDALANLASIQVPLLGDVRGVGEASSARATWLLDQTSVPTSLRSIEAAGRQLLGTTGEGNVRDNLQRIASGEAGRFFVDRTGVVTLTWHDAEYARTSAATFADDGTGIEYESLDISPGVRGVTNTANVKRTGPRLRDAVTGQFEAGPTIPDVVAADGESVAKFGTRSVTYECVLGSDSDALSLATFAAQRRSQPTQRVNSIVLPPLDTMPIADVNAILNLDIGSLVTVIRHTYDGRQLTFALTIEGITVDAVPGTTRVTLTTAPSDTAGVFAGAGWFLLDTSALDGIDVLTPF